MGDLLASASHLIRRLYHLCVVSKSGGSACGKLFAWRWQSARARARRRCVGQGGDASSVAPKGKGSQHGERGDGDIPGLCRYLLRLFWVGKRGKRGQGGGGGRGLRRASSGSVRRQAATKSLKSDVHCDPSRVGGALRAISAAALVWCAQSEGAHGRVG